MDPVRDLNNYISRNRDARGNLARHFSWSLRQEGPDRQKTHYATAKLHGQNIGSGCGLTIGSAKQEAATQALQYLESLPAKHPLFSLN